VPLIHCPDCGRQISDAAPTCPGCGRPFQQVAAPLPFGAPGTGVVPQGLPQPVHTIELTAKKWKLHQIGSGVTFTGSCILSVVAFRTDTSPLLYLGLSLAAGSFCWAVVVQILMWWHHG